tara:strand:+ start:363 stop:842 length:480 start_codon:yes stop_codon:yes gene_type:complete
MLQDKNWHTGSNRQIKFDEIKKIILEYVDKGARIYIGSDSFITQGKVCFASTICLHGPSLGGRYFFFRENLKTSHFLQLVSRITEETRRSVEIAEILMSECMIDPKNIELHLDVSPFQANNSTSRFSEMLRGYVIGFGLDCKLKPNAWAGQTVADKHSK